MAEDKKDPKKEKLEQEKKLSELKKQAQVSSPVTKQMDELMRRLRLLEERYSGLRKKTQFTEQNMLKDAKELFAEIKIMHETISELKSDLSELNEKMIKLRQEVKSSVKKTDFNVLAKYIDYWQPLNYITKEEAEKLLNEK